MITGLFPWIEQSHVNSYARTMCGHLVFMLFTVLKLADEYNGACYSFELLLEVLVSRHVFMVNYGIASGLTPILAG